MDDHYKTLNVSREAPVEEIRRAYRALIKDAHPDRGGADSARAQRLNEAVRVLSNEYKRADYNRQLEAEGPPRAEPEAPARAEPQAPARAEEERRVQRPAESRHPSVDLGVDGDGTMPPQKPQRIGWGRLLAWGISAAVVVGLAVLVLPQIFGAAPPPTENPGPTDATGTPTPTPSLPQTTSDIDLTQVADAPDLAGIAATLDAYFSGINAHDAPKLLSAFAPGALKDPTGLIKGTMTTHDDLIRVISITPTTFDGRKGYDVQITFRSHQAPSQGGGQACTGWSATERLVRTSTRPLMLAAVAQKTPGCPS
jgi:hypothetical protein